MVPLPDAVHAHFENESTETLMTIPDNCYMQDFIVSQGDYATNSYDDNVFSNEYWNCMVHTMYERRIKSAKTYILKAVYNQIQQTALDCLSACDRK